MANWNLLGVDGNPQGYKYDPINGWVIAPPAQKPFNTGKNITEVLGDLWDASKLAGMTPELAPIGGAPNIPVATRMAGQAISQGAKAGAREIAKQIENGTGVFGKLTIDPRMYAYLPSTPKNPNPLVGTRYTSEAQGNLVKEIPLKMENLEGASIKIVPYDLTSADQKILSVSDEKLNNPVYTMGGVDFSRLPYNYENNIGGASNFGIAKRVLNRTEQTRKENIAQGGSGDVYKIPITMGENSEWFSTYPTDVLKELVLKNSGNKDIKYINKMMREASIVGDAKTRPFGNFKGIETPEGQQQFLTGEGFGAGGTAGEFRKAFVDRMALKGNQERFGYNIEDVINSTLDPRLINVPKGYGGLSVVKSIPNASLTPSALGSKIGAYDTDLAGTYAGSLGLHPIEVLMPKTYNNYYTHFQKMYPKANEDQLRKWTIGAIERRKDKIGEYVDRDLINNFNRYQEGLLGK